MFRILGLGFGVSGMEFGIYGMGFGAWGYGSRRSGFIGLFYFCFSNLLKGCPKVIHSLMMECWESDKNKRPKFAAIVSCLDKIIRSPDVLKAISLAPEDR